MKHRKRKIAILATVLSLGLASFVYGLAAPSNALAWDNCPKGLVNDPYPGACRRYVDTNGDSICDLSQSKPKDQTTTTTALAVTTATGEPPTGNCPLGPCSGCGACVGGGISTAVLATGTGGGTDSSSTTTTSGLAATEPAAATVAVAGVPLPGGGGFLSHYLVSPIALGFILIYGASFILSKTKRIRTATHRKVWNVMLLGTFLVTGIFGTLLAIQLDYTLPFSIPIDLLFWHVEAGIAMTFISLFHMGWHFKYYKRIVESAREKFRALRSTEKEFDLADRRLVLETREARRAEREARRIERERRQAEEDARLAQRRPAPSR